MSFFGEEGASLEEEEASLEEEDTSFEGEGVAWGEGDALDEGGVNALDEGGVRVAEPVEWDDEGIAEWRLADNLVGEELRDLGSFWGPRRGE